MQDILVCLFFPSLVPVLKLINDSIHLKRLWYFMNFFYKITVRNVSLPTLQSTHNYCILYINQNFILCNLKLYISNDRGLRQILPQMVEVILFLEVSLFVAKVLDAVNWQFLKLQNSPIAETQLENLSPQTQMILKKNLTETQLPVVNHEPFVHDVDCQNYSHCNSTDNCYYQTEMNLYSWMVLTVYSVHYQPVRSFKHDFRVNFQLKNEHNTQTKIYKHKNLLTEHLQVK